MLFLLFSYLDIGNKKSVGETCGSEKSQKTKKKLGKIEK